MAWLDGSLSPRIMTHDPKVGLLWLVNSALPIGLASSAGKVSGIAKYLRGRPIFGMDQDILAVPTSYKTPTWLTVASKDRGNVVVIGSAGYCHSAYGSIATTTGDRAGGLWRIRPKAALPMTESDYMLSGNDAYVGIWEPSRAHLIDHAFDLHIRPGENDCGEKILNSDYTFEGIASEAFDNFFSLSGQELSFIPSHDCNVYMVAAIENSRGSASEPLKKFVTGPKCKIAVKIPSNPLPDMVVGLSTIPGVSADWLPANRLWLAKILSSGTRDGADLAEWLDVQRADDTTTYEITAYDPDLMLRPGDWIWADGAACRIRKIIETSTYTTITAGRMYLTANERWGEWRTARGSIDVTNEIQSKEFDFSSHTGSTTFTVKSGEKTSEWRARLNLSWKVSLTSVGGGGSVSSSAGTGTITPSGTYTGEEDAIYTIVSVPSDFGYGLKWKKDSGSWTTLHVSAGATNALSEGVKIKFTGYAPQNNVEKPFTWYVYAASHIDSIGNPCVIAKINDQIIPPGRIRMANALSGSVDIDITDCCRVGSNTFTATVYGGMTKTAYPNHYHQLSGTIKQYQRARVIANA